MALVQTACAIGACQSEPEGAGSGGGEAAAVSLSAVGYLSLDQDRSASTFTPFCTATLIAPRVVATAAHCVHDRKLEVAPGGPVMTFARDAADGEDRAPAYVAAIYEDPAYDPSSPDHLSAESYQNDFALLLLEAPLDGATPAARGPADWAREHLAIGHDVAGDGPPARTSLAMKLSDGSPSTYYAAGPSDGSVCDGSGGGGGGPLFEIVSGTGEPTQPTLVGVLADCPSGTLAYYAPLSSKEDLVARVLADAEADAVDAPEAPLELPSAPALPLGPADVLRIGATDAIEIMSAWFVGADGSISAWFDRSDASFDQSEIYVSSSRDGRRFTVPARASLGPLGEAEIVASPTVVAHGAADAFLYFVSAASLQVRPTVARAKILPHGIAGEPEPLDPIPGVDWALSWPSFAPHPSGTTLLAFRDGRSRPRFAASALGRSFATPSAVRSAGAAMASVAALTDGTLVYTFQESTELEPMVSQALISHDGGETWSEPVRIAAPSNVHDTSVLPRSDGNADLYYIYPPDDHGFSLFRRTIAPTGALGPEQRLTESATGEPSKPRATRLADGRVLVAWADIAVRDASGQPAVQQLVVAELPGDAPAP